MSPEGKTLLNIIILGLGFMVMFTAFGTCGNIEQTVIKSFNSTEFHGSGYTSMAIIYAVFSASNLIAPSVIAVIGPQLSLFFSGLVYSGYIAVFIHPYTSSFYTLSVLLGIAAAVLWTAQGNLLTINSKDSTIGRNSGIFWALMQFSLFFGNLYIYFAWRGKSHITSLELTFYSGVYGTCLGAMTQFGHDAKGLIGLSGILIGVGEILGLELTFYSGVYGTCLGAMTQFGHDAKGLIGLSGILIGVGEILGGGVFGILDKCNRFGRNPVVFLGLFTHIVAFYLIFLNIASDAPVAPEEGTQMQAFIQPSVTVALICSFLLGLGDSCFNTQLISIVGFLFRDDSASAFAVFKFVQSITAAVAFFYSNYLLLHWQLLIMVLVGFLGTITFFVVERGVISSRQDSYYDSI
ncbi:UNC93-like protein MFSD11 [Sinocyclocheilus rhinocerous]|uniref:UNC93-like protein MFSD11 n=1 Tax=Sinocyclocheilus rhinocerous TaxID=307959 RepID=UPI0007B8F598|nr:PREDICTED: UNC93-like protein MFSD11 [Sinocyclocheilus rhinocerous]